MRKWDRILGVIVIGLGVTTPVAGALVGGTQLEVLEIGYAAAPLAIAESGAALRDNPYAALYNPASGIGLSGGQLHSSHSKLSDDTEIFALGVLNSPDPTLVYGLLWTQYQISGIPLTDIETATPTQDISPSTNSTFSSNALTGFFAKELWPNMAVGLNATGFISYLSGYSKSNGWGYSVAPGFRYQISPIWSVGGYIRNAISYAAWNTGTRETFSPQLHVGTAATLGAMEVSTEYVADWAHSTEGELRGGVSVRLFDLVTLRAGAYSTHFTAGMGLDFKNITLDYAFTGDSENRLSDTSRFNFGVKF